MTVLLAWPAVAAPPWETAPGTSDILHVLPPAVVEQVPEAPAAVAEPPSVPMDAAELAKINDINANLDRAEVPIPGVVMEEEVPEPFNVRTVILQGLIPLFIVIALVLLAYAGLRKLGKRNPLLSGGEHMTCIGRLYLDRTSRIHLVRVGGRVLVVGTTGNAVTLLGDMDANAFSGDGHAPAQPVEQPTARQSDSFYDELQANLARINRQQQPPEDADIEQIRTEIVRLKRVLEDEPGEHAE